MKSYTDLQQSKKLAEILPLESADMCYIQDLLAGCKYGEYKPYIGDLIPAYGQGKIRCWSLAALLGLIPHNVSFNKAVYRFKMVKYSDHWECYHENFGSVSTKVFKADNPVDACIEMILKLHEFNLL